MRFSKVIFSTVSAAALQLVRGNQQEHRRSFRQREREWLKWLSGRWSRWLSGRWSHWVR
ncbi:hypothetical protein T484DRAFT_3497157 [Baffinella frigidus]|nr:hypothetical protein T484DRAFT_3497157 [Cryptophyta sp. CCMP2293]